MVLKIGESDGEKVYISYPAIFSDGDTEKRGEFRIKLVNFGQVFEDKTRKWAYTKAKAFLLDKINEYRKTTGKSAREFLIDFPPNSKEELVSLLQKGEEIAAVNDEYDEKLEEFFETTMFEIEELRNLSNPSQEMSAEEVVEKTKKTLKDMEEFAKAYGVPLIHFSPAGDDDNE